MVITEVAPRLLVRNIFDRINIFVIEVGRVVGDIMKLICLKSEKYICSNKEI